MGSTQFTYVRTKIVMVAEYEKENLYDLEFQIWEVVVGEQLSANLP